MSTHTPPSSNAARLRRLAAVIATAGLTALASACSGELPGGVLVGSGEVTSETREVSEFTEVEAHGGIALELSTGPSAVVVTAQSNLLPITTTVVQGSRLVVDTSRGYTTTQGITAKVTMPKLTAVSLSGGSSATATDVTAQSLAVEMSGGARLTLSGTVDELTINASGGAVLELGSLRAKSASVDLSGGVVATLAVSSSLRGNASGGVVVNLATRPSTVDVETSGGAAVVGP